SLNTVLLNQKPDTAYAESGRMADGSTLFPAAGHSIDVFDCHRTFLQWRWAGLIEFMDFFVDPGNPERQVLFLAGFELFQRIPDLVPDFMLQLQPMRFITGFAR